jgi:hypothetical protein
MRSFFMKVLDFVIFMIFMIFYRQKLVMFMDF